MTTIRFRRNGPIVVDGVTTVVLPDGTEERVDRLFLCRCGQSATRPMCDGTHKRCGFVADGEEPPTRPG